jgi:hypothetical protein
MRVRHRGGGVHMPCMCTSLVDQEGMVAVLIWDVER